MRFALDVRDAAPLLLALAIIDCGGNTPRSEDFSACFVPALGVALSGANAIDCGLLHIDGNRYSREDVTSCAHRAAASGKPYRFGFGAVGVDSGLCNVAVRTADGSKYYLEYNYDLSFPDGDKRRGPTLYVGRCETIEFLNRSSKRTGCSSRKAAQKTPQPTNRS